MHADAHPSTMFHNMFHMFSQHRRKERHVAVKKLQIADTEVDTSSDGDDSRSVDSSYRIPTYQTHAFQQRFHEDHPVKGVKMVAFSSFMKRAVCGLPSFAPDDVTGRDQPTRSYDRNCDESNNEDEVVIFEKEFSKRASPDFFGEQDKGHSSFDDNNAAFLFAQHAIIRTNMLDLGSRNALHRCQGEDSQDDEVESIEFEMSDDFQPRFQPTEGDEDLFDAFELKSSCDKSLSRHHDSTSFQYDAFVRPCEKKTEVEKCFQNILLVSPMFFDTLKEATAKEKGQEAHQQTVVAPAPPFSPSLSTMVHSMDIELFETSPESAFTRQNAENAMDCSVSFSSAGSLKSPTTRRSGTILQTEHYTLASASAKGGKLEKIRRKLASSFRSKASGTKNRVAYSLSKGKGGMSKKSLRDSQSLLPAMPLLSEREQRESSTSPIPRSLMYVRDLALSILLLHPVLRIFEIVVVDVMNDTTVGDVLSKARANAMDESLSAQKYVSLCNRTQELAAPMLPVSLLVPGDRSKERRGAPSSNGGDDCLCRREMEGRLLVAVPECSTAVACQSIRRVLWKNPKVQRWWNQSDPFHPVQALIEGKESSAPFKPRKI